MPHNFRPQSPKPAIPPAPGTPAQASSSVPAAKAPDSQLSQTAKLMQAVFNEQTQESTSLQTVFKALERANTRIVIELPWYKDGGRHQLVIKGRSGSRLVFYNPLGHGSKPAGTELTDGLKRRVEADGTESAEMSEIELLFRLGKAKALISPPVI